MKKEQKIAVSIFAIAFCFGLNITGVMPVLGMLSAKYQNQSTSMIQMMQTIHYALQLTGSFAIGWLTTKISKKKIVIIGLLIIGICGSLPFLSESFFVLTISRVLIGFGFGITGPIDTAVVADFFEPDKRAGYLGLHVVGMGIGAMFGNLLGGILAQGGLRYYYLIHMIAFLGAFVVLTLLPETPPVRVKKVSDLKLTKMVYVISLISFMHTLFINAYGTNISMYITQSVTEDPGASGIATAVNAAFALLMGLAFTKVCHALKNLTLPFAVLSAAVGYASVLMLPGMAGVLVSSALCGVSLSCFSAMGSYLLSVSVEQKAVAKASGFFAIVGGIGGLIAPIILGAAATAIGGNTPVNQFRTAFAGMLILGGVISVFLSRSSEGES